MTKLVPIAGFMAALFLGGAAHAQTPAGVASVPLLWDLTHRVEKPDTSGLRLIRFLTEDGRTLEMFSPHERDLTLPYVWLPMGANPRETRPTLLELDEVFADLS